MGSSQQQKLRGSCLAATGSRTTLARWTGRLPPIAVRPGHGDPVLEPPLPSLEGSFYKAFVSRNLLSTPSLGPPSGTWGLGSGYWDLGSEIWGLVSGVWVLESGDLGTWGLGSGNLGPGIWGLGSWIWSLVLQM